MLREDFVKAFTTKGGLQGEYLTELQKLGFFKDKGFVTMTEKGALELDNKGYAFFMRDNLNNLDKGVRDALIKDNLVKEVDGTFKVNYEAFSNDELSVMFKDQLEGGVAGQNALPSEVKDIIRSRGGISSPDIILSRYGEVGEDVLVQSAGKSNPVGRAAQQEVSRAAGTSQGAGSSQAAVGANPTGPAINNSSTYQVMKDLTKGTGSGLRNGTELLLKNWKGAVGLSGAGILGYSVYNNGLWDTGKRVLFGKEETAQNESEGMQAGQQDGQSYMVDRNGNGYGYGPNGDILPVPLPAGGQRQDYNNKSQGGGGQQNGGGQSFLDGLLDKLGLGKIGDFFSGNGIGLNITGLAGMAAAAYLLFGSKGGWMSKIFGGLMAFLAFQSMTGGSSEQQDQGQYLAEGRYEEEMERQLYDSQQSIPETRRPSAQTFTI